MGHLTLAVAFLAGGLIFMLRPFWSVVIYLAVMAFYPANMTVKIGTVDFTACRIVILLIFANIVLRTDLLKKFKLIWMDKLIIIYFFCQLASGATHGNIGKLIENRAGAIFDTFLPYLIVRLLVRDKQSYLTLLKAALCIAAPLAIIGFYQSVTGHNIAGFLKQYYEWGGHVTQSSEQRLGFYRADFVFPQPIMFGLFFAMLGPVCAGLFKTQRTKELVLIGLGLMGLGAFSSLSSGPLLAGLLAGMFIFSYRFRRYWKVAAWSLFIVCLTVEVLSNRHFYDVLGRFTLTPGTAWYRSKLMDVALFEGGMRGHWIFGYGVGVDPGWGARIDGRFTDIVNHYLLILCRFGIIGIIPFAFICREIVKHLRGAYRMCMFDTDRWMVWCLSGALFGLAGAFFSVSLFGQSMNLFYILIGLAGCIPEIIYKENYQYYQLMQAQMRMQAARQQCLKNEST